jgi:guanosine-3',5'-bis(diphosphate) 3'-pyrophosphohydrolase
MKEIYYKSIRFAGEAHGHQRFPGTQQTSYMVHVAMVAAEITFAGQQTPDFDWDLAIACALLHDVVEDTPIGLEMVETHFGERVAAGVSALTKNADLPKHQQMQDSLQRIQNQPVEVWAVKLADRICNLQEPPAYWSTEKRQAYQTEAKVILAALGAGNAVLKARLELKIRVYEAKCRV